MAEEAKTTTSGKEETVPLENRIKEAERKLSEKYEKELEAVKAELAQVKAAPKEEERTTVDPMEAAKADLMRFVSDPKGFVREAFSEQNVQRELAEVRPWLAKQEGYTKEDDARLMAIETEYQLAHSSPLARASAAWSILQKEKTVERLQSNTEDSRRETTVRKTMADGGGKTVPIKTGPNRADLIKALAESEKKGDLEASVRLMDKLEDMRE